MPPGAGLRQPGQGGRSGPPRGPRRRPGPRGSPWRPPGPQAGPLLPAGCDRRRRYGSPVRIPAGPRPGAKDSRGLPGPAPASLGPELPRPPAGAAPPQETPQAPSPLELRNARRSRRFPEVHAWEGPPERGNAAGASSPWGSRDGEGGPPQTGAERGRVRPGDG